MRASVQNSLGRERYIQNCCLVNRTKHAIRSVTPTKSNLMNNIVYIVGLVVIIIAILSFFALR